MYKDFPEYPKIKNIFNRDHDTHKVIEGEYATDEFKHLANNQWRFTEKINGMNMRIFYNCVEAAPWETVLNFKGKTDKAQIPAHLKEKLDKIIDAKALYGIFADTPACLYGEGYGHKIQSGGIYCGDEVNFILFDIMCGGVWLKPEAVEEIAGLLRLDTVPWIVTSTLGFALTYVRSGVVSELAMAKLSPKGAKNVFAEGLVGVPVMMFRDRMGHRINVKIKHNDFYEGG